MKFISANNLSKAFTLIELLVVIAIIGLLSSIVLASLSNAKMASRDARRMQDLNQIRTALEMYYTKYGYYPQSGCGWDCNGYRYSYSGASWAALESDLAEFIPKLPIDPVNSSCSPWTAGCYSYAYGNVGRSSQRVQYDLTGQFETPNHPQSCAKRNYTFYFNSQPWCGGYSGQLFEASID